MKRLLWIYVMLFAAVSCVDRINFDPPVPGAFAVVIDGYITDQPGPYDVKISKAFDIQSKSSIRAPVNVTSIVISDNVGNSETLVRTGDGNYQTSPGGIRGVAGRAYKMTVVLLDGRVYESVPDTLYAGGSVDKISYDFVDYKNKDNKTVYGFDVFFDSRAGTDSYQYMWKFTGTFQIDTNPEQYKVSCGEAQCPRPLPCSAFRLAPDGSLQEHKPCECCTCWISIKNEIPIVSDNQLVTGGKFTNVNAGHVPLTQWTFMHKTHIQVQQLSLSPQAFAFWKAVKAQKQATTSLFQPLTGKIVGNFRQVSGVEGPVEGIFFASSVKTASMFINKTDIPNPGLIPPRDLPFEDTCISFGNATTQRPAYWE